MMALVNSSLGARKLPPNTLRGTIVKAVTATAAVFKNPRLLCLISFMLFALRVDKFYFIRAITAILPTFMLLFFITFFHFCNVKVKNIFGMGKFQSNLKYIFPNFIKFAQK
jgi:hypothetical protein